MKEPSAWWKANTKNIPLFCEIRNMVRKGRLLLQHKDRRGMRKLMFVEVRGVTLLVGNHATAVVLALTGNAGMDAGSFEDKASVLGWFLTELAKDIKTLLETRRECCPEVPSPEELKTIKEVNVTPPKERKTIKEFKVPSPKKRKTVKEVKVPRAPKKRNNMEEFRVPSPKK